MDIADTWQAAWQEWVQGTKKHLAALGLPEQSWLALRDAVVGERWVESFTVGEWHNLLRHIENLPTAADITAFIGEAEEYFAHELSSSQPAFAWSANAVHIQSLYQPWSPADGYAETVIVEAERRLDIRFPELLRTFYQYWGRRKKLIAESNALFGPPTIKIQSGMLLIACENQGVYFWGIRLADLPAADPPIYWSYSSYPLEDLAWEPSHPHLSDFLDAFTYMHAFYGGANYSGQPDRTANWAGLQQWQQIAIPGVPMWYTPDSPIPEWIIYTQPGQAIDSEIKAIAARTSEDLDKLAELFHITWHERK